MEDNDKDDDNNKDDNNDKGISALGLDTVLGFLRGHQGRQGHRPHDDDDEEEEDNEVEDHNDDKGLSALGLDRDQGFSRGHLSKSNFSTLGLKENDNKYVRRLKPLRSS